MSSNRTLITGAAGFVGAHLARRLLAEGDEVHAVLRPSTRPDRIADLAGDMAVHRVDLADMHSLAERLGEISPTRVFHLAADTRGEMEPGFPAIRRNIAEYQTGTLNLVEALARLPRPPAIVVRAGSIAEYGLGPVPFRESQREQPTSPYGAGLAAMTHYLTLLAPTLPFTLHTARLALVYGAGQAESFFVSALVKACLGRKPMTIRHPEDRRDLLHIDDAVDALVRMTQTPGTPSALVNVGTGISTPMRELAGIVLEEAHGDAGLIEMREHPSGRGAWTLQLSTVRMKELFGWTAQIELSEGIARTIADLERANVDIGRELAQ